MKEKTYKILKWVPVVNLFLPRVTNWWCGSHALEAGAGEIISEYLSKHPELKGELLTDKLVKKIISEAGGLRTVD